MKMRNKRKALHKKYGTSKSQPTLNQESFDDLCEKARNYLKKTRHIFAELMDGFDKLETIDG